MMRLVVTIALLTAALIWIRPDPANADGLPSVSAKPLNPGPGEVITVRGQHLGPNSVVEVRLIGLGLDVGLGEVKADGEGDFLAGFRLPEDLRPGIYRLRARGAETATTDITVGRARGSAGAGLGDILPRERPLPATAALLAFFGVLAALGIFFARTAPAG